MPGLAGKVIAVYKENDRRKYLDNLFRLQIVAGRYADAKETLASLRALPASDVSSQIGAAQASVWPLRRRQEPGGQEDSFRRGFPAIVPRSPRPAGRPHRGPGDALAHHRPVRAAADLERSAGTAEGKKRSFARRRPGSRSRLSGRGALGRVSPLAASLIDEDDRRRYVVEKDIPVKTADGATVCALVVRPRSAAGAPAGAAQFHHLRRSPDDVRGGPADGVQRLCRRRGPHARQGVQPRRARSL